MSGPRADREARQVLLDGIYDAATLLVVGVLLPVAALRAAARPDLRARVGERIARYPAELRRRLAELRDPVWVHAVSVGEVRAVLPLVRSLRSGERAGGARAVVLSTVTVTGNATARAEAPDGTVVIFLPVDLRPVVRRAIAAIRPRLFVSTESEIWPALIGELARRDVPVAMVNGRVSERTARRYRWVGFFMRPVLAGFRLFCMQSPAFAERIVSMGAPSERVEVLGNLKYDLSVDGAEPPAELRRRIGLPSERPLVVAGSTHEGEETALLDAQAGLDARGTAFDLLLAPRHPERFEAVARLLSERGVAHRRWSAGDAAPATSDARVVLLDAMGWLTRLYAAADVAFVGGTLAPIGGHNLLEPAALGKPVLFGPHTESCSEIAEGLLESGGGLRVADGAALTRTLGELLGDPERARATGEAARAFLARHRGATERTVAALEELLA